MQPRASGHHLIAIAPLLAYSVAFAIVLASYGLSWSYLYPPLTWDLILFIAFTIFISLLLCRLIWILKKDVKIQPSTWWTRPRTRITVIFIYALSAIEFLHAGGIPAYLLASGADYDYRSFGIPTLHVFLFGFYNFLVVHWFSVWLRSREKIHLYASFFLLLLDLAIINRGAILQALLAMGALYIIKIGFLRKKMAALAVALVLMIYGFGAIGDSRMAAMGMAESATILTIGDATENYPTEAIGTGPFWFYIYLSSPLANWQLNVTGPNNTEASVSTFFALEILPDFISKYLVPSYLTGIMPDQVTPALTVSSGYGRAYYLYGWAGDLLVFILFLVYYLLSLRIFRGTEYFDSAMATMCAGAALLTYYNMLTFAGFVGPMLVAAALRLCLTRKATRPQRSSEPQ